MYLQQRDFIPSAKAPTESVLGATFGLAAGFGSILAAFLNALHRSRRLTANRIIHQHRNLIADSDSSPRATD